MRLYDVVHEKDGTIKLVTELTVDDINAMLELALGLLLSRGMVPTSIAHHYKDSDDSEQATVTNEDVLSAATPPSEPVVTKKKVTEASEEEQRKLLETLPTDAFHKA